jgi:hypothetical protein
VVDAPVRETHGRGAALRRPRTAIDLCLQTRKLPFTLAYASADGAARRSAPSLPWLRDKKDAKDLHTPSWYENALLALTRSWGGAPGYMMNSAFGAKHKPAPCSRFSSDRELESLRYIGPPSIVRLWKFLHTRARQRRLRTEFWRE